MSDQQLPASDPAPASPRRLSKRSIVLIAVGSAVVLAVAATATAFALAPRPVDEPAEAVVDTPTTEPTPSALPTEEPIDGPVPRFDLDCDKLVPPAVVTSVLGQPVESAGNYPVRSIDDAASVQRGVLECTWLIGQFDGGSWIRVGLMPEAGEAFQLDVAEEDQWGADPDAYGDASRHWCSAHQGRAYCRAEVLVGDVWVGSP